jgi:hypothetical protein
LATVSAYVISGHCNICAPFVTFQMVFAHILPFPAFVFCIGGVLYQECLSIISPW